MCKVISLLLLFAVILFLPLNAGSTFSGQRVYLKECRTCHMGSKIFLHTHTSDEWNELLDSNGSSLSFIHLSKNVKNVNSKDGTIEDSHSYFKSEKYKLQYSDLRNFIIQFSKNSDNGFYNH